MSASHSILFVRALQLSTSVQGASMSPFCAKHLSQFLRRALRGSALVHGILLAKPLPARTAPVVFDHTILQFLPTSRSFPNHLQLSIYHLAASLHAIFVPLVAEPTRRHIRLPWAPGPSASQAMMSTVAQERWLPVIVTDGASMDRWWNWRVRRVITLTGQGLQVGTPF